jgi:signal transduction histidine kinase
VYSQFPFAVATPWYATTWAFLGYAGAVLMLVWGLSSLRARAVRKRNIRLSQMVEEQTAALRRNIRVRDHLMSIITHDILTPLRFIGLIAKHGSDTTSDASSGQPAQALADVRSAIGKLFHSTQNMLHWATYHREGFRPVIARCAPFVVVDQLVQDFSEMSQFQGNEMVNEVPEDDVIRTDAQVLQVILHNLLSNAMKFTASGRIVIRSASTPDGYMLEVEDNGRGMSPDQLDAVRTGALNRLEMPIDDLAAGTGIGLSLVAELVDALGGRWTIDSAAGRGVVVRIVLPEGDSREPM